MRYTKKSCYAHETTFLVSQKGAAGTNGGIGLTGVAGTNGTNGTNGATGTNGGIGLTGAAGTTGGIGLTGAAGTNGTNGTNATVKITELSVCGVGGASLCKIGMQGPGGGIIFFVDYNDQYTGFNYLEVAPQGWGDGIAVNQGGLTEEATGSLTDDPLMKWCSNTGTLLGLVGWDKFAVGAGASNTSTADTTCAGGAIQAAADYGGGSVTNWFLPSRGEAMLMYTNLVQAGVGGFAIGFYWSSSEHEANRAWGQSFHNGGPGEDTKNSNFRVRPVRAF